MTSVTRPLRPLVRVALPVAVAAVLVCLAILNIALVRSWRAEADDGILWQTRAGDVVAVEIAPKLAGDQAGVRPGDVLLEIDGAVAKSDQDVKDALHRATAGQQLVYHLARDSEQRDFRVTLQPLPTVDPLYYPLAIVGILAIALGASVRLRRPTDPATLHYFWLSVAFGATFAFTYSGRFDRVDYFFYWADDVARLLLPGLFLHFAFVFPDRSHPWVKTDAGRAILPVFYLPAPALLSARAWIIASGMHGSASSLWMERLNAAEIGYLCACLLGGLGLMLRALGRLRSVTARRQLRWIVWG